MKLPKIILFLFAGAISVTSCDLDEQTFTFVSGDDVAAAGGYDNLVASAYESLEHSFEWGNYHTVVNFDCDYQTGPTWAFGDIGAGNFYNNISNENFYRYYFLGIHRANYFYSLVSGMSIDEKILQGTNGLVIFTQLMKTKQEPEISDMNLKI